MSRHFRPLLVFTALTLAAAVSPRLPLRAADAPPAAPAAVAPPTAVAVLVPTQGNDVRGTVRFTKVNGGVRVVAEVTGLKPGDHGFHVHEFGDASSADGTAAGGHFNPAGAAHAGPAAEHRHTGDLGNIKADANGRGTLDYVDAKLALDGAASILGRAVVIHANPDDLTTQPAGNAGPRVAVGVIGLAKGT